MKSDLPQLTIRSLMIVVAAVAWLLSVPRETWSALGPLALNGAAMMLLVLPSFGFMVLLGKLASGAGLAIGDVPPPSRPATPSSRSNDKDR